MPVNVDPLISQINTKVESQSLSDLELLQLSAASAALTKSISKVSTITDLPDPTKNTGRMIYIESVCDYRYSNGESWSKVYDSTKVGGGSNTLWSWGLNSGGQLGDNTVVNKSSPVSVVGGFTDWCQVSVGETNTAAIRTNGTLWSWGSNGLGHLGDNTTVSKSSPVSVVGGFTDWCQVSVGNGNMAAIRTNGTLWTWGYNAQGQLGDNTSVSKSSPVSVVGGFTDWSQVSAGYFHSAAIRTNGTLWSWGYNAQGQLGDNTTVNKSSPISAVGGFTDWCQVSAGRTHTAALRTNGTLWTWGSNTSGQLGDNSATTASKSSPVSVVGGFTDWSQVSAGYFHSAAIRTNGTLWSWGYNAQGQLGDNTTVNKSSPISAVGGFTDWCQVSAGRTHTAALRTNGTLWTWGSNTSGRLGDNSATTASKSSPVSVVGGFNDWGQVSAGGGITAAIRSAWKGFDAA